MAEYHSSGVAPGGRSTTDAVRQEAGNVGQSATQAAGQAAQTTKEQAREVTSEVGRQARDLVGEARTQARDQASKQRDRAVNSLRALSDELDQMADRGRDSGMATELARQLSSRTREVASFIEDREPGDLVEEVRSFARRRSGAFLVGAALAGVAVGRLTRAAVAQSHEQPGGATATPTGRQYAGPGQYYAGTGQYYAGTGQYEVPATDAPTYAGAPDEPYRTATPDGSAHAEAGQPEYGQPGHGQPEYGQPDYGQPGYGQPQQQQGRTP
jgi:hypothetical protein